MIISVQAPRLGREFLCCFWMPPCHLELAKGGLWLEKVGFSLCTPRNKLRLSESEAPSPSKWTINSNKFKGRLPFPLCNHLGKESGNCLASLRQPSGWRHESLLEEKGLGSGSKRKALALRRCVTWSKLLGLSESHFLYT